jgi:acyl-CoA thioesterase FadM
VITVTCENPIIEEKNIILEQRIINSRGKDAVKARITSVFLSKERGRSVPPPALFQERFVQTPPAVTGS